MRSGSAQWHAVVALVVTSLVQPVMAEERKATKMILNDLVEWLAGPGPLPGELTSIVGGNRITAMPPNQFLLKPDSDTIDRIEVVVSDEAGPAAPVSKLNLILRDGSGVTARALDEVFGAMRESPEDGKPRPAALVRFHDRSFPARSLDVIVSARVDRPVSPTAVVRSIQLVRSPYRPRP